MQIIHKAKNAAEMKAEILHFLKHRASQERAKEVIGQNASQKSLFIARASFLESLIKELENAE